MGLRRRLWRDRGGLGRRMRTFPPYGGRRRRRIRVQHDEKGTRQSRADMRPCLGGKNLDSDKRDAEMVYRRPRTESAFMIRQPPHALCSASASFVLRGPRYPLRYPGTAIRRRADSPVLSRCSDFSFVPRSDRTERRYYLDGRAQSLRMTEGTGRSRKTRIG